MTRRIFRIGAMLAIALNASAAGAAVFNVPDGNYQALRQAINDANATPERDTILLAPGGTYRPGGTVGLPLITEPLRVYGQDATIDGAAASGDRVFDVADNASLLLSDLNIINIGYTVTQGFYSGAVINNLGNSALMNVTVADTALTVNSGSVLGVAVGNSGTLTLSNVTLSGNEASGDASGAAIYNQGNITLENVTITDNRITGNNGTEPAALVTVSAETVGLFNSIVGGNPSGDCNMAVTSGGGNLDSDNSCGLDAGTDNPGVNPNLGPLSANGGALLTHAPNAGSAAVNGGVASQCTGMDARGLPRAEHGTSGTGARCDIGAFERRTSDVAFQNGHSGSWFDPQQNGHGFMFEILPPGDRVLITWFVFDASGNRDWVQAVGPIRNGIAKLTGYRIEDGAFPPAFDEDATTLRYWGTISFAVNGCAGGSAAWMPGLLGYEPGGMPLTRLTSLAGLNCS